MIRLCIRHVSGMPKVPVEESLALMTCNYLTALKRAQVKIFAALATREALHPFQVGIGTVHILSGAHSETRSPRGGKDGLEDFRI